MTQAKSHFAVILSAAKNPKGSFVATLLRMTSGAIYKPLPIPYSPHMRWRFSLEQTLAGNTVAEWLIAAGVAVAVWLSLRLIRYFTRCRLKQDGTVERLQFNALIIDLLRSTKWYFEIAAAAYIGSLSLTLPKKGGIILKRLVVLVLLAQILIWGFRSIHHMTRRYRERRAVDGPTATSVMMISLMARLLLIATVGLLAFDNLGIDVTALVAGLGIGGIAVALATQNILGDLISSLSIVFDKPFNVGDFIIVDQYMGTVEHIGLKTTRIRSLWGELLVISNGDLLKSRIRNYKQMYERRVVFTVNVIYETPLEQLKAIPDMIREIVSAQPKVRFDRAHFQAYGEYALTFEVIYIIANADHNFYMDVQQQINLALFEKFAREKIYLAYRPRLLPFDAGLPMQSTPKDLP